MFGPHLIIDGSKCNRQKLADRRIIERILTEYPRAIGMTRIGGPYMFEYQAPDPAYSGVSGIVVIAESHIAIHTFPELDYFSMDIFSCKNFDHEVAIDYIRDALDVKEMDRMLVQRGLSFRGPHHGPLGATDELIAAANERIVGLEGITIGSIPADDPLYPKSEGKMIWPTYGLTPDYGSYGQYCASGARCGSIVKPANAAAAGDIAPVGLTPIQPLVLNPTASVSGIVERMGTLSKKGRELSNALTAWEKIARQPHTPVILALGPGLIAEGMREVVTDLMHRGHINAIILEGDNIWADAYESLGFRHYSEEESENVAAIQTEEEWNAAQIGITAILNEYIESSTAIAITRHLGESLAKNAPRYGVLSVAALKGIPVFATGETQINIHLAESDVAALATVLQQNAMVIACGTSQITSDVLTTARSQISSIAIDAAAIPGSIATCRLDAAIALPFLATGLIQRIAQRHFSDVAPDRRDSGALLHV